MLQPVQKQIPIHMLTASDGSCAAVLSFKEAAK